LRSSIGFLQTDQSHVLAPFSDRIEVAMKAIREVLAILNMERDYDRQIATGVSHFAHDTGGWRIYLEYDFANRVPDFHHWHGHGIIADLEDETVLRAVLGRGVPTVGIGGAATPNDVPAGISYVATDNIRIAQLAADHLLQRGYHLFGFCGIPRGPNTSWAVAREEAFGRRLAAAGFSCSVFRGRYRRTTRWDSMLDELAQWLEQLPRPIGLMACDDPRARHVLLACRRAGLRVPEDAVVIGVDNDEIMCEMVEPTLTSIQQGTERIGYEAAALLDRMMRSQIRAPRFLTIPPIGIVTRRSTNAMQVDDDAVSKGLQYILDHKSMPISAATVARHVGLSRGMLDIRFHRAIGSSIYATISRSRLNAIRELLVETTLPLKAICPRVGIPNVEYLVTAFRRWTGQTPGEYRKANRPRGALETRDITNSFGSHYILGDPECASKES
jgi:LacI family transcriptional regulator